jgi:hypothetical protein
MLSEDGVISFVPELLDLVDALLVRYEAKQGVLSDPLERGLALAYLLGALCSEARAIAACLESAPILEGLQPQALLQECVRADAALTQAHRERITSELVRRGWLTPGQSG